MIAIAEIRYTQGGCTRVEVSINETLPHEEQIDAARDVARRWSRTNYPKYPIAHIQIHY